jgi:NADH-quinone oxidoreductase subunit N
VETRALDNVKSLVYFSPELVLIAAVLLIIMWDLVVKGRAKLPGILAIGLGALAYNAGMSAFLLSRDLEPQNLFYGLLAFDRFSNLFRIVFALVTASVMIFSIPSDQEDDETRRDPGEFFCLLIVLALGMNLMAESRHLLMIYLSLELVSVISFVMAGFKINDAKSSEAAMKYVIFGGVASGIMLYGMSWIFGLTQSLYLGECAHRIAALSAAQGKVPEVVFVGTVCMMAGFGYKISAAPFHMWTPDVYEGAPTAVTAFLSVGPKAAGFAMLVRFFSDALGAQDMTAAVSAAAAAGPAAKVAVETPWPVLAGCLAMATMTIGNLSALGQDNVKRMLAYSSVAHAGYMLLGFCVFNEAGVAAIAFYVVTYCFMNLGAFLVVMAVAERSGGNETINAFRGLGRRAPVMAVVMAVFLFSLTGLPPMAGFVGKFYIFSALLRAGGTWNWVLAVVGVVNSVVSLFYYARVLRAMYLEKGETMEPTMVRRLFGTTSLLLAVPTLILGVYWGPVYDFVARSLSMVR